MGSHQNQIKPVFDFFNTIFNGDAGHARLHINSKEVEAVLHQHCGKNKRCGGVTRGYETDSFMGKPLCELECRLNVPVPIDPPHDCALCPRLKAYRDENVAQFPNWFNGPVPVWAAPTPKLVIVGLAPGLKGANQTGRPFTGDYAGDLLYATLKKAGMARGDYDARADDGLELVDCMIVNAVRCVPPQNKPVGAEITNCRQFLLGALGAHPQAKVFLALGRIAHESFLTTLGVRKSAYAFGHAARHQFDDGTVLYDSYHCSRYNTNTRRLTTEMFEEVVFKAAAEARG